MCICDADLPLPKKENSLVRTPCVCRSQVRARSQWSTVKKAERRRGLSMKCSGCRRRKNRCSINTPDQHTLSAHYQCTQSTHPIITLYQYTTWHTHSTHSFEQYILSTGIQGRIRVGRVRAGWLQRMHLCVRPNW